MKQEPFDFFFHFFLLFLKKPQAEWASWKSTSEGKGRVIKTCVLWHGLASEGSWSHVQVCAEADPVHPREWGNWNQKVTASFGVVNCSAVPGSHLLDSGSACLAARSLKPRFIHHHTPNKPFKSTLQIPGIRNKNDCVGFKTKERIPRLSQNCDNVLQFWATISHNMKDLEHWVFPNQ